MKILLAGLGSIGQRHARNLRTLLGDRVELLAYRACGTSPVIGPDMTASAGDPAAAYGIRSFRNLDEALAQRPDAVFVTNTTALHMPVALAAATAGCHLFVEKPLSHDWEGVTELTRLVEEAGIVCLVGYQLRFHPGFRLLGRLLAERAVGALLAARIEFGEYLPSWHPWEDYREGSAAQREQGGGVVLAQIHDLDVAYALFGPPRRVFALGGKLSSLEIDVEDTASILLDCEGVPVHVHQDLLRRPPRRTYEVIGEEGTIVWDYHGGTVVTARAGEEPDVTSFDGHDRNELYLAELRHFLACIDGRERPVVGVREGAETLRVALAAKRSLETGEVVSL